MVEADHVFAAKASPGASGTSLAFSWAVMRDFVNKYLWVILAGTGSMLIAILSLVPGYLRPHTGAPGSVEHFAAYLVVAGAFAMGLRSERSLLAIVLGLMLAAGLFELLQIDIPGRSPGLTGFISSSLGAWTGLALANFYHVIARRTAVGR
jgi:VanZ family protein